MAKIAVPREQLEGFQPVPEGVYEVRLAGFRPKKSKDGASINLRPELKIVNNPNYNGQYAGWENLNTGCWYLADFAHCFGCAMEDAGGGTVSLPGEFAGPDDDPTKWVYHGPLAGKIGKIYLKLGVDNNNKPANIFDHYFCAVAGCAERHTEHLAK